MNYLWCSRCHHATPETSWSVPGSKYGVCRSCGESERFSVRWEWLALANNYPVVPIMGLRYSPHPELF